MQRWTDPRLGLKCNSRIDWMPQQIYYYFFFSTNKSHLRHGWTWICRRRNWRALMCNTQQADRWMLRLQNVPPHFWFQQPASCQTIFPSNSKSWQCFLINSTMLGEGWLQKGDELSLWLRSIGFHSARCSLHCSITRPSAQTTSISQLLNVWKWQIKFQSGIKKLVKFDICFVFFVIFPSQPHNVTVYECWPV